MRIEHVAIWCEDLELLKGFYEEFFLATSGEKYINSSKGFASYFLTFGSGPRLELMQMESVRPGSSDADSQHCGISHIAISVDSEKLVDELTEAMSSSGHVVVDGPRRTGDGYYESVVLDPENNRIEITA